MVEITEETLLAGRNEPQVVRESTAQARKDTDQALKTKIAARDLDRKIRNAVRDPRNKILATKRRRKKELTVSAKEAPARALETSGREKKKRLSRQSLKLRLLHHLELFASNSEM